MYQKLLHSIITLIPPYFPMALSQEETLEELKENIKDAIELILEIQEGRV
jgi:predicted RNase H-like HicB family nuclease